MENHDRKNEQVFNPDWSNLLEYIHEMPENYELTKPLMDTIKKHLYPQICDYMYDTIGEFEQYSKAIIFNQFKKRNEWYLDNQIEYFIELVQHYDEGKTTQFQKKLAKPVVFNENFEEEYKAKFLTVGNYTAEDIEEILKEEYGYYLWKYNYQTKGHKMVKEAFAPFMMNFIDFPALFFTEMESFTWMLFEMLDFDYSFISIKELQETVSA